MPQTATALKFLSTLSLRRATPRCSALNHRQCFISIHALLAESDASSTPAWYSRSNFYPRSPCGERQIPRCRYVTPKRISIHALLAESDPAGAFYCLVADISIHALLAESDCNERYMIMATDTFLSTLSLRRATCGCVRLPPYHQSFLSTLSLRRATITRYFFHAMQIDFYPRSPCGERPRLDSRQQPAGEISIHALLAESDHFMREDVSYNIHFYPRSPCGERPRGGYLLS